MEVAGPPDPADRNATVKSPACLPPLFEGVREWGLPYAFAAAGTPPARRHSGRRRSAAPSRLPRRRTCPPARLVSPGPTEPRSSSEGRRSFRWPWCPSGSAAAMNGGASAARATGQPAGPNYHGQPLTHPPLVIEGGTVVDPLTGGAVEDGVLVLDGGKVTNAVDTLAGIPGIPVWLTRSRHRPCPCRGACRNRVNLHRPVPRRQPWQPCSSRSRRRQAQGPAQPFVPPGQPPLRQPGGLPHPGQLAQLRPVRQQPQLGLPVPRRLSQQPPSPLQPFLLQPSPQRPSPRLPSRPGHAWIRLQSSIPDAGRCPGCRQGSGCCTSGLQQQWCTWN